MWLLAGLCASQLRGRVGDNDQRVVVGVEGIVGGAGGCDGFLDSPAS